MTNSNVFNTLAHTAVAALLASSGAAQPPDPGEPKDGSFARCTITGKGVANSKSEQVGVDVGAHALKH